MRQVDGEMVGHAGQSGGRHRDMGSKEHRFLDAMGHEHDGLAAFPPDPEQFQVHSLSGRGIKGAEGFIHQDELGVVDQGAGDGGALLHAAGQLMGVPATDIAEPRSVVMNSDPCNAELARAGSQKVAAVNLNWAKVLELMTAKSAQTGGLGYFDPARMKQDYAWVKASFDIKDFDIESAYTNEFIDPFDQNALTVTGSR